MSAFQSAGAVTSVLARDGGNGSTGLFDPLVVPSDVAYLMDGFDDPDKLYREQRAVRTVTGFIARNLASIAVHGFRVDADGEKDRQRGNRGAVKTLTSPDRVSTQFEWQRDKFLDLLLWERFAALKVRHADGGLLLLRIPPRTFRFETDAYGRKVGVKIKDEVFPIDKFFWLDGYAASDGHPMRHLSTLLFEEAESAKARVSMWKNGARHGGVITRPNEAPSWTPRARNRFKQLIREGYVGDDGTNLGGTMLLEDGMQYEVVERLSAKDSQQIEARKLSVSEVSAAYYVPPVFVGVLDNANYSNVKAYKQMLYSDVLGPTIQQDQQAWNLRVVPDLSMIDEVEYNTGEKLRLSFEEQATVLQAAVGGPWMLRDEARHRVNLPKLPDGKGAELIEPLNLSSGDQQAAEPPADEDSTEDDPNDSEGDAE